MKSSAVKMTPFRCDVATTSREGVASPFHSPSCGALNFWRRFFLADMMGITYDEPTIDYGNGDIVGGHVMGDIANDIPSGYLM